MKSKQCKPLSVSALMCCILPCIGLQVKDDGVVSLEGDVQQRFIGPLEEYRPRRSQGVHVGAEHLQQTQQSRLEHINWQQNVRKHAESTGGAFVGHVPVHILEHLAES